MATLPVGEHSNEREGKPEMVKFILETLKLKPTLADETGNTAIHWVCWYDDPHDSFCFNWDMLDRFGPSTVTQI